jgi:hypothetical protein
MPKRKNEKEDEDANLEEGQNQKQKCAPTPLEALPPGPSEAVHVTPVKDAQPPLHAEPGSSSEDNLLSPNQQIDFAAIDYDFHSPIKSTQAAPTYQMMSMVIHGLNDPSGSSASEALEGTSNLFPPAIMRNLTVTQHYRLTSKNEVVFTGRVTFTGTHEAIAAAWLHPSNYENKVGDDFVGNLNLERPGDKDYFPPQLLDRYAYGLLVKNATSDTITAMLKLKSVKKGRIDPWTVTPVWAKMFRAALGESATGPKSRIFALGVTITYNRKGPECHLHVFFATSDSRTQIGKKFLDPSYKAFHAKDNEVCGMDGSEPWYPCKERCCRFHCDGDCKEWELPVKAGWDDMLLFRHHQTDFTKEPALFSNQDLKKVLVAIKEIHPDLKVRTLGQNFVSVVPSTNMLIITGFSVLGSGLKKGMLRAINKIVHVLGLRDFLDSVGIDQLPTNTPICDICGTYGHHTLECDSPYRPPWMSHSHRGIFLDQQLVEICVKPECLVSDDCRFFHKFKVMQGAGATATWVTQIGANIKVKKAANPQAPASSSQRAEVPTNLKTGSKTPPHRSWPLGKATLKSEGFAMAGFREKIPRPTSGPGASLGKGTDIPPVARVPGGFSDFPANNGPIMRVYNTSSRIMVGGGCTVRPDIFAHTQRVTPYPFVEHLIDQAGSEVKAGLLHVRTGAIEPIIIALGLTSGEDLISTLKGYPKDLQETIALALPAPAQTMEDFFDTMGPLNTLTMAAAISETRLIFLVMHLADTKGTNPTSRFFIMASGNLDAKKVVIILIRKEKPAGSNSIAALAPIILSPPGVTPTAKDIVITQGRNEVVDKAVTSLLAYLHPEEQSRTLRQSWRQLGEGTKNKTEASTASSSSSSNSSDSAGSLTLASTASSASSASSASTASSASVASILSSLNSASSSSSPSIFIATSGASDANSALSISGASVARDANSTSSSSTISSAVPVLPGATAQPAATAVAALLAPATSLTPTSPTLPSDPLVMPEAPGAQAALSSLPSTKNPDGNTTTDTTSPTVNTSGGGTLGEEHWMTDMDIDLNSEAYDKVAFTKPVLPVPAPFKSSKPNTGKDNNNKDKDKVSATLNPLSLPYSHHYNYTSGLNSPHLLTERNAGTSNPDPTNCALDIYKAKHYPAPCTGTIYDLINFNILNEYCLNKINIHNFIYVTLLSTFLIPIRCSPSWYSYYHLLIAKYKYFYHYMTYTIPTTTEPKEAQARV